MARVRSLPSDYVDVQDQTYDPNYISDISKKMQVPEHICVDDGSGAAENMAYLDPGSGRQFAAMNVPDRIIVAGKLKKTKQTKKTHQRVAGGFVGLVSMVQANQPSHPL
jgi:hypothetical protein